MKTGKIKMKLPKGAHINHDLDIYADTVLFPEKLKKAKDILKKVGIPKI